MQAEELYQLAVTEQDSDSAPGGWGSGERMNE